VAAKLDNKRLLGHQTTPKRTGAQRSGNKVIGEKLIRRLLILLPQAVCVDLPKT
jgi:hypothetical protein